jgi:hypothetical protein
LEFNRNVFGLERNPIDKSQSDGYFMGRNPQGSSHYIPWDMPKGNIPSVKTHGRRDKLIVNHMIKWNRDLGIKVGSIISRSGSIDIVQKLYPEAYPQASLMLERLVWHQNHFKTTGFPPIELVADSFIFGPTMTSEYEDAWKRARFRFFSLEALMPSDDKNRYDKLMEMNSFSACYSYRYFIFWEEECDDYLRMFESPPDSSNKLLADLEYHADILSQELLTDEEIHEDPPLSYLYGISGSKNYDADNHIKAANWELEYSEAVDDGEEEVLIGTRSFAPKRAGEIRDIICPDPRSRRRHKRLCYHLARACKKLFRCPFGGDQKQIDQTIEWMSYSSYWYMRDWEKCGLTFPHPVIRALFKGFFKRRPELVELGCKFYSFIQLHQDGSILHPKRGHFLGYFTEGTTIIQYCIHRIVCEKIGISSRELKYSAVNDDMVVGSMDKEILDVYAETDSIINYQLGLLYKESKSGIASGGFVFLEEYYHYHKSTSKEHLTCLNILGGKYTCNIAQAKQYIYALLSNNVQVTELVRLALNEVIAFWGYEFYPEEHLAPYLFGGWTPCIKDGVDYSIKAYNGDIKCRAAYWAVQQRVHEKLTYKETPSSAISRILNLRLFSCEDITEEFIDLVPLFGTKKTIERRYSRMYSDIRGWQRYYYRLEDKRQQTWSQMIDNPFSIPEIYSGWYKRHWNSYIIPEIGEYEFKKITHVVDKPKLGLAHSELENKLTYLALQGKINYGNSSHINDFQRKLYDMGIFKELELDHLYCDMEEGVSVDVLRGNFHPIALKTLYEERSMTPIKSDSSPNVPWAPLMSMMPGGFLICMWPRLVTHTYNNFRREELLEQFLLSKNYEEESDDEPDTEPPLPVITDREILSIADWIDDTFRDHPENRKVMLKRLAENVIFPTEHQNWISELIAGSDYNNPLLSEGDSTIEQGTGDQNSDDEFEDPWAELGVF